MISCRNLYKSYSGKSVLSGINISIGDGEIFGLLGPSGAGKTTLISIITGQLSFDKGDVTVLDKNVKELTGDDRKKIGIMMDNFGVYERFSCSDNMKTSGLDPQTMKQIHRMILDKNKEGCTIFLTTHNMEEAAALCDNVALLNEGGIVECGAPEEVVRKYNHQKKIMLHLTTGEDMELPHDEGSADRICALMKEKMVETIHSSEPNLETVFLELTGRKLQEA